MASAIDVARYLVKRAAGEDEPEFLSHLRLQKLLYYVQGWHLALRGSPMFSERIEAWAHGPVVKSVYAHFAGQGFQPIDPENIADPKNLTKLDASFIDSVWLAYKGYSATSLREMTHKETPWVAARGNCGPADKCTTEITQKAMRDYFSKKPK